MRLGIAWCVMAIFSMTFRFICWATCFADPVACVVAALSIVLISGGETCLADEGFELVTGDSSGIDHVNEIPEPKVRMNINLSNGNGVAIGDYDGDGLNDLYFTQLFDGNRLYRNMGNWRFEEVSQPAGVRLDGHMSTGCAFADFNGDGRIDLFVGSCGNGSRLFMNNGDGRFIEEAQGGIFDNSYGTTSIATGDLDNDGDLDIYVANYGAQSLLRIGAPIRIRWVNGKPVIRGVHSKRLKMENGQIVELGEPDIIYINRGDGKFSLSGLDSGNFKDMDGQVMNEAPWEFGLAVMIRDFNGDGFQDIYVGNDFHDVDRFWINNGTGVFQELDARKWRSMSRYTMSIDAADINKDGLYDIFTSDMLEVGHEKVISSNYQPLLEMRRGGKHIEQRQNSQNSLLINHGNGYYVDTAFAGSLSASGWSWGAVFLDVDLDGYEDLLIATGYYTDMYHLDNAYEDKMRRNQPLFGPIMVPNKVFRNNHDNTFSDYSEKWAFDSMAVSGGVAMGDLDNDGDQDVVVVTMNNEPTVYRNLSTVDRIRIQLEGAGMNRSGIGAEIEVHSGGIVQRQHILGGGRYMSSDAPERTFARLDPGAMRIAVRWPDGLVTHTEHKDEAMRNIKIRHADAIVRQRPVADEKKLSLYRIEGISGSPIAQRFQKGEDLVSVQAWSTGPFLCGGDWDSDGAGDVIYSAADKHGFAMGSIKVVDGKYGWSPVRIESPDGQVAAGQEVRAVLHIGKDNRGGTRFLMGGLHGLSEWVWGSDGMQRVREIHDEPVAFLAMGDLDNDGNQEVVQVPLISWSGVDKPGETRIFRDQKGDWRLMGSIPTPWPVAGIAIARFFESFGPGEQVIFASRYGGIRMYQYQDHAKGSFEMRDVSDQAGVRHFSGLWHSVSLGDYDSDGRVDLILGNVGINHLAAAGRHIHRKLHHLIDQGQKNNKFFESVHNIETNREFSLFSMKDVAESFPLISKKFGSHKAFSEASVNSILEASGMSVVAEYTVKDSRSRILWNNGDSFSEAILPNELQWTTLNAAHIVQTSKANEHTIFICQNSSDFASDVKRQDAGIGLVFNISPDRKVSVVGAETSGVYVSGDQTGLVVHDFNRDGKSDILVGRPNEPVILLQAQ